MRPAQLAVLAILVLLAAAIAWSLQPIHIHADLKLFLNGTAHNFSQPQYLDREGAVHFHGNDGDVVHIHARGVMIADVLASVGMELRDDALTLDRGQDPRSGVRAYVNGAQASPRYQPQDLDRILITDGIGDLGQQLAAVTDKSCIQSSRCPERGAPSEGGCVAGTACQA